jgi:hypothetical protein
MTIPTTRLLIEFLNSVQRLFRSFTIVTASTCHVLAIGGIGVDDAPH